MTGEEAIRILDPETTEEALAEIEYYNGFSGKTAAVQAMSDACVLAVAALREQEERDHQKPLTLDELRQMDGEPVFLVDLVHKSEPETPNLWGGWIVFTSHNTNGFIPRGGGFFSNDGYGKTWLSYRSKPKEVKSNG